MLGEEAVDGLVHVDHVVRVDESVPFVVFDSAARGTPRPGAAASYKTAPAPSDDEGLQGAQHYFDEFIEFVVREPCC